MMQILDLCQGFGGGVLLGGGLLHLMAESGEHITNTLTEMKYPEKVAEYPWAPLLAAIALGIIFFVEMVLTTIVKTIQDKNKKPGEKSTLMDTPIVNYEHKDDYDITKNIEAQCDGHGHSHGEISFSDIEKSDTITGRVITASVLWLSLSTHSVFAGLAFGPEDDENAMWSLFTAIVAHQIIEAFALGVIINEGFKRLWLACVFIITYSISLPAGIAIGIGIAQIDRSLIFKLIQYCLVAFAAGAFLHVSLFEILFHSPKNATLKMIRFVLYCTGFAMMAVIALWA
jgi:zinc transporter ZupT